jgi:DNA-binding CsgD family transcriptional regulator
VVISWDLDDRETMSLTAAERAVAALIARGKSNEAIAKIRGTSTRTVANQVASLLRKLGLPSRHHLGSTLRC